METFSDWLLLEKKTKRDEEDEFDGGASDEECKKEPMPKGENSMMAPEDNLDLGVEINNSIPQNAGLTPEPVFHKKVTSAENFMHNTLQQTQDTRKRNRSRYF